LISQPIVIMKRISVIGLFFLLFSQWTFGVAYADDAAVLPKGIWRFYVDQQFYLPITEKYDKDGHKENVAAEFNVPLDVVQPGIPGRSVVSFSWDIKQLFFAPAYGLTDKLSVGIIIPYIWQTNTISADVDATAKSFGITANDIQNILVARGFQRLQTWSDSGLGDIEAGGRYQYFKSDSFQLAFTGGVRFPTGKVDDPNNLGDRGFGDGVYALLFRLQQDYIRQTPGIASQLGVPEPGSFLLNTTFRYDLLLPDTQWLRVCNFQNPACTNQGNVHRNLGDVVEAEISGSVGLFKGLYLTPLFKYGHKFGDHYSGDQSFDYQTLADETRYNEYIYKISLSYSNLAQFLEKKFPFPFIASIGYRDRFAGNNNLFVSQYIDLVLEAYF